VCPFIDKTKPQCAVHLTLRDLSHAMNYCANRYTLCPIYQDLTANEQDRDGGLRKMRLVAAQ